MLLSEALQFTTIMKVLGNIIWVLFGGLFLALGYLFSGLLLCLTIIGIPFGWKIIKLAGLALWPFGKEVKSTEQATGCLNTGMNVLWFLIGGIWLGLEHAILGLFFFITINININNIISILIMIFKVELLILI